MDQDEYGYYIIEKPSDYVRLANYVNSGGDTEWLSIKQTNDLDFSLYSNGVTPIGISSKYSFNGMYFGEEHSVYNFTISSNYNGDKGFFGYLGAAGSIWNLNMMSGQIVANSGLSAGAVVGSTSSGSVYNCTNWGVTISADNNGSSTIGGIVGYASGTADDIVRIEECGNFTSVINDATSTAKAGGIVGHCAYGYIDECMNTGTVRAGKVVTQYYQTTYSTDTAYAGGILGYGSGTTVWYCHNMGSVIAYDSPTITYAGTSSNMETIKDCQSIGGPWANTDVYISAWKAVTTNKYENSYAGGIAGYIENKSDYASRIKGSLNTGEITSLYEFVNVSLAINAIIKPYNQYYIGDRFDITGGGGSSSDGACIACVSGDIEITDCYSTKSGAFSSGRPFNTIYMTGGQANAFVYHPMQSTYFDGGSTITEAPTAQKQANQYQKTYYWDYATVGEKLSGLKNPRSGWFEYCIEKFSTLSVKEWETLTEAYLNTTYTITSISVDAHIKGLGSYYKWSLFGDDYKQNSAETSHELRIFSTSWAGVPDYCENGIVDTGVEPKELSSTYWFTDADVSPFPLLRQFFWKDFTQRPQ